METLYLPVIVTFRSIFSVSLADFAVIGMVYSPASTLSEGVTVTVKAELDAPSTSIAETLVEPSDAV